MSERHESALKACCR